MSKLRCLAVDDEPLALHIIEEFCRRIDTVELVAQVGSAVDAGEILKQVPIDLVFLDVNMPHVTGIDLMRCTDPMPMVIFTTAYPDYAVTGFELDAVDYLLKPFSFDRFARAVERAITRSGQQVHEDQPTHTATSDLFVRVDYATVRISSDTILWVEGVGDYVRIVTDERSYVTKLTLKKIGAALDNRLFMRIHKSYLVNLSRIEAFESGYVVIGSRKLPVGARGRRPLLDYLHTRCL